MTKTEALKQLSEELGLTQKEAEEMYESLVGGLTYLLKNDKGFTLPGLGSFSSEIREAHKSYNPHYQQMMLIPKKKVVHYSQSSVIRDEINGEE